MTTIRRVPIRRSLNPVAQSRSGSSPAGCVLFFEPNTDCLARDTKHSLQPAHRTAFFVCLEDDLFLLFGIALGLRVITTAAVAVATPVALFPFWSPPIADDLFTFTVATFESDCDHSLNYL